ncbi:hypothetical protein B1219_20120 [Pseudomonas ogarae]|nr:hypothetical protein B1219_20120 [Pseudomonas ogarae]OPG81422.1 hypothetical protein B1218_00360 [Pseudomonas ogarae]
MRFLWRGSLLPLGCAAAPIPANELYLAHRMSIFATAAQPSGSKLPRHKGFISSHEGSVTWKYSSNRFNSILCNHWRTP